MIARLCNAPGCQCITAGYYCAKHKALSDAKRAEHKAERKSELFKGTVRKASGEYNHLYHTRQWRRMRRAWLDEHPYCVICGAPATVADHITPHRGCEQLFYNENNLQSLCASCHSAKTLAENEWFRARDGSQGRRVAERIEMTETRRRRVVAGTVKVAE